MDNEIVRSSTVFYESFVASTKDLPADEFKEAWMTIFNYAFYDEEPGELSPLLTMFYRMAKPNIDRNIQNRENGTNGGRPKKPSVIDEKPKSKSVSSKKPSVAKQKTEHIYDEDVDVDEDVSVDADVVVDVEAPAPDGGLTTTTDNTLAHTKNSSSDYGEIPTMAQIAFEFAKHKYKPEPTEMERFVRYNRERKWKLPLDEAVTRWIANEKKRENKKKDHGFDEHDYDFDEIDRKLMLVNQREAEEYEQRNMDQPVGSAG